MAFSVDRNRNFPSVFFQLQQYSRHHPSFSAHMAALMTKNYLDFFQHFLYDLWISLFNSAFAASFHFMGSRSS